MSIAQLSVRNNHFVFVSDEVVFVEDDINLNESNSRIYLRNEGQLIQGNGTTGNTGIGELSVYQEANVGPYQFNYWCAPIGSTVNSSVNNPFGISLLNDPIGITNSIPATFNSSSSYNGTSSPLNIEPYWIWKFVAANSYSEWFHVKSSTSINPGEGFTMKGTLGSGNAQRYDFRGKPNNGTISVTVLNNQFTLVGNPYPSAIDAVAYIHDPENSAIISGTLYFWEQNTSINSHSIKDYEGGYATYTISSDGLVETYTPAAFNTYNANGSINNTNGLSTSGKRPRRYIPIGQGFMVEGISNGAVKAKNSHRVFEKESGLNSEFFKSSHSKEKSSESKSLFSIIPNDYKRFRLNIDFNNHYTRQLVETFHPEATDGFDYGLESKINPGNFLTNDAYFFNNDNYYLAEALAFREDIKIPVVLNLTNQTDISIRITDIQNFENSHPIFIHDLNTNTYLNLREQDFKITLDAGTYSHRFEITFKEDTTSLAVIKNELETIKFIQNNSLGELIILNPNGLNFKSLKLFDITGKKVMQENLKSSANRISYSTKHLSDGVYIIKLKSTNRQIFSKKVVISNKK